MNYTEWCARIVFVDFPFTFKIALISYKSTQTDRPRLAAGIQGFWLRPPTSLVATGKCLTRVAGTEPGTGCNQGLWATPGLAVHVTSLAHSLLKFSF